MNQKTAKLFRKCAREVTNSPDDAKIAYQQLKAEFEAHERERKWQKRK